ncbi:MAG: hypothetical protein KDA80_03035 [Planctomycetaceae bacterium]|nr:hypothetical protein [Planctomycetaceae bacterium]
MDPYAPCPCGSGKKVKFCCQAILPEMEKIQRLQENNQPRMAIQLIDKLREKHPENGWLVTQRAMALLNERRLEEARDDLVAFLRKCPDHPLSNALLAVVMIDLEPISKCMKVIHRAFLKSMMAEPQLCAFLAEAVANYFLDSGQDMAARQHMAMVLRLGDDQQRQEMIMAMLELDADGDVPYPLRGGHPLPEYAPAEDQASNLRKAQRLYLHGCFAEAADLLEKIAAQDPDSASLQHMIGLMRAWGGEDGQASIALHKAAQLYADQKMAVDVETLAQLLDKREKGNLVAARIRKYNVEGLSRLLTRLDNEDRLCRMADVDNQTGVAAVYDILDRPLPPENELSELTMEQTPRSIGKVTLFDGIDENPRQQAMITALEGDRLNSAVELFEKAAGELATAAERDEETEDPVVGWYSRDELALTESAFFPPKTPGAVRRRLRKEFVRRCVDETWLKTPQDALQGKTPEEAIGVESLHVPLAAAIRVFDAYLDRRDVILDKETLTARLQLPMPEPIRVEDVDHLNILSVSDMEYVPLEPLSNDLFYKLMQRALVVKHCGLGYKLLSAFLTSRDNLVSEHEEEAEQAHASLAEIASRAMLHDEALEWIEKGFQFSKARGARFQQLLGWKMRELIFRSAEPETPEMRELLLELWNYYGAKVPEVRQRIAEFVKLLEIDPPWENAIVTPGATGEGQAVWTAESEQATGGPSKLWLPD